MLSIQHFYRASQRGFNSRFFTAHVSVSLMGLYMGVAMIAGVFLWESLSSFFNDSSEIVHYSTATFRYLAIPYFFFALGTGLRSLFIGTGKTIPCKRV